MDDTTDHRLATAATILIVVLLLGQVVLLAAHLWAPMARTADRLIVDENAPLEEGSNIDGRAGAEDARPLGSGPWRWVALGLSLVSAGIGLFGAWRLHAGSAERNRWMTVLVIAGLAVVWGIFTFRLIARSAVIFEGF